ncbi:MAG: 1-acyl-sn-glycerol-3-phosphate acyltransferase, partial [Candidatus Marinimicrobia bacterium]|nr:1-acyl-sn-glycerol-3-phosphate acyltransferase [Candidatus Neomarinimicrobiota bacterium]
MIRNILSISIALLVTVLMAAINLFYPPLHSWLFIVWSRIVLILLGVKLNVSGKEHLPEKGPGVIIINHESALDIPIAVAGLQAPVRFMAKRELFKVPIFGWCLALCNHIPIDRQNRKKAIKSINKVSKKLIRKRIFVIVSPEGTRSHDGQIRPYKKGAFRLADAENLPLIPVTIMGARYCIPKKSFNVVPGNVDIVIDKPVYVHQFANVDECIQAVWELMVKRKETYE